MIDALRLGLAKLIAPKVENRYEGAWQSHGRSRIPYTIQSPRLDATRATRETLLGKSRYFYRNNGFFQRFADIWEQYTVGTGLIVQPTSSDDSFNDAARTYWNAWCRFPDLESRLTFGQLQSTWALSWFLDGDVFVVLTQGSTGFPRIQTIEGHRCVTPSDQIGDEGKTIVDGVQIDPRGRPSRFWFTGAVPGDKPSQYAVSEENVIQIFEPSRPGQYRGLPIVTPVINDLQDLDDLQLLEMKACRDAAEITRVLKTQSGEVDLDRFLDDGGYIQTNNTTGQGTWFQDRYGGSSIVLKSNEEFEQFMSNRPTVTTMDYWRLILSKVASGIGIPYSIAFPDSMQGTVYRASLDISAAFFRARSSVVAEGVRRIYEYVIQWGLKNGGIRASNVPDDWFLSSIRYPRAINVDIGYQSQAAIADLKAGIRTWDDIYGQRGEDWRSEWRKKAEEIAYREQLAEEFQIEPEQIADLRTVSAEFANTDQPEEPETPEQAKGESK